MWNLMSYFPPKNHFERLHGRLMLAVAWLDEAKYQATVDAWYRWANR